MIVRLIDASAVQGGKAFALCDDDGKMIGRQSAVTVSSAAGETSSVTVTFYIDGETIRFG